MKKIILLSDSHHSLDERIFPHLENCDEIWHAGDIGTIEVIEQLSSFKPLRAVYGNIDNHKIRAICPKDLRFECEDVKVWITHIGGYPYNYTKNIRAELEKNSPDLFICGHSHILKVMYDKNREILHLNPGAAGNYGIHKVITMLRFDIEKGEVKNLEVIEFNRH